MEKKIRSAVLMQNSYFDHPTEEDLERFLLRRSQGEEIDLIETHILACESCVARLEALETEIPPLKLALEQSETERLQKEAARAEHRWTAWLTFPRLSLAGAAAVLLLGVALAPQFIRRASPPVAEITLSAYRGVETPVVPLNRPLHLHLNALDLAEGPVTVQIVNSNGFEIWKRNAAVHKDEVSISVPNLQTAGAHLLRLYSPAQANGPGELLREFAFRVK
ncbi:MAG: hypothetical protein JO097_08040 [Acidobacteriaceae bacterium]|nr:hypothetical protein [Acidobacteriaceae bacterium]MBV9297215.1 hypothetical protein [Acidobacteriaceae bacterium]